MCCVQLTYNSSIIYKARLRFETAGPTALTGLHIHCLLSTGSPDVVTHTHWFTLVHLVQVVAREPSIFVEVAARTVTLTVSDMAARETE
jgi:hypothetical protein